MTQQRISPMEYHATIRPCRRAFTPILHGENSNQGKRKPHEVKCNYSRAI